MFIRRDKNDNNEENLKKEEILAYHMLKQNYSN